MSLEEEKEARLMTGERKELEAVAKRFYQYKFNNNNLYDNVHKTALFYVILCEQFETAKLLISFGADVRVKNDFGQTALQYAVSQFDSKSRFSAYAERKFDCRLSRSIAMGTVNLTNSRQLTTQSKLNKVCNSAARLSLVKTLLKAGADVNNKDYCNYSPIHCAVYTGDLELLKTFIDAGADINSQNGVGATALHVAVSCCDEAMVRLLLRSGARVDIKTLEGNTPLHWAALLDRGCNPSAVIKALLNYPVDVNSRNYTDQTPFHYIMCNFADDSDMLGRFMELKADINAKDVNGATPFSLNGIKLLDPKLPLISPVNIEERRIIIERVATIEATTEMPMFSDYNLAVINESSAIKSYYEKCRAELKVMKEAKIKDSSLTHLKILTEPLEVLSRYARNEELLKRALEEFLNNDYQTAYPIYGSLLRAKLYATAARRRMIEYKLSVIDQVSSILSRTLQFDASDVWFEIIFKYLSNTDLDLILIG